MAEPKGVGIGEVEHHLSHGRYPRDLMQRLNSTDQMRFREAMVKKEEIEQEEDEEEEEIELNLGLSLGGRFGVDPPKQSSNNNNNNNKLLRSSSMIAGLSTTTFLREDDAAAAAATTSVVFPLIRTSSLPMESEEEWRKRKELQSLRRMEAKRKRSVKQKNIKLGKERASLERNSVEEDGGGGLPGFLKQQQQQQQAMFGNGFAPPAVVTTPFGMPNWASSAHRGSVGSSGGLDESNSILAAAAAVGGGQGYLPPSSQGSVGSHGSSSSAISEFESLRPVQGLGNCNEARSPSSVQSVPEQKPIATSASTNTKTVKVEEAENPSKKPRINDNGIRESGMKVMEEMPCVSTKGDGPNGRRIEGFLYKYKKGEEVRIVCVCHGSFLTPAEFVKHAGGGDVAHPLRHIVVTPSPSFL